MNLAVLASNNQYYMERENYDGIKYDVLNV